MIAELSMEKLAKTETLCLKYVMTEKASNASFISFSLYLLPSEAIMF